VVTPVSGQKCKKYLGFVLTQRQITPMRIFNYVKGIFSILMFALNTIVICLILYVLVLLKKLSLSKMVKEFFTRLMVTVGEAWIAINNFNMDVTQRINWDVRGLEGLSHERSYLVFANHQSWMDIVILQYVLNGKIPFMRFFLKKELIYVPFLGGAWMALDFPFMKRYSISEIKKNPEKRREDFETAKRTGERFRGFPVSILNFVEGTRFTQAKHDQQKSPYKNLLVPKAGGVAAVLQGMGENFHQVLDVTIVYPDGVVSLMQAFMGQLHRVRVQVRQLPVPVELTTGDYFNDPSYRQTLQAWIRGTWMAKDELIEHLSK
jgi:1-acyl-sn-glycerol-3-phosphate acyltransferase